MKDTMRLKSKVAVVTGASQGLGEHLSRELAREGARVVLAARNGERLAALQSQIERSGGSALSVPVDLQREEDCQRLVELTLSSFGKVDILVLNAGSATLGKLEELQTFAPIRDSMATNLFGAAYPTYLAVKHVIESKGTIAYVTSGGGHLPMAGYLGYTTSKHAMNGFFEALRLELRPHGVNVIAINPGDMYSDDGAGRTVLGPEGAEHKVDLSVQRKNDISRTPASEVAKQCVEGIVARKREVDLSPRIQKLSTRLRPLMPELVDRQIEARIAKMRSAFTS
jgi:NAD(P)-dependent dehydrogenase (short-subunit alcohol dehydrogenase family)